MKNKEKKQDKNSSQETAKTESLKEQTQKPSDYLTTNQGTRISDNQNTLKAGERGPALMEDFIFREKITHFDHERIPERVVHARGSAAHGVFRVYESMKEYTKAKFLQDPHATTPVFVRFSTVAGFRGSADTIRDVRGFATKFYTEEGNFDLVGNNIPIFFIQDAIKFPDLIHAVKPEPHNEIPQASSAHNNFWDFISLMPESIHMIMWVMSDRALPRSYSMMEGFGVHTFRFINEEGKSRFVKFHWKPLNGVYSLLFEEAQVIAGKDPDFNRRDLWESIERGNFPEFELGVQILEENELQRVEFDILDPTKIWPEEDVPVKIIGKMTLNRNPDNFFAETEQVAFHPGHILPGIDFTNDPLLQGRLFSYLDTQLTRLGGPNFHEIPINRPLATSANNQRDGIMRQTINKGQVNYEPNSLASGCPMQAAWSSGGFASFAERMEGRKLRIRSESFNDHYTQATLFWNSMSEVEKRHIISAFHFELGKVDHMHIREKMVDHLNHVNHELAIQVAKGINVRPPNENKSKDYHKSSAALSQENHKSSSIKGRKVAILAANGIDFPQINQVKNMLEAEGALTEVIAKNLSALKAENGEGEKGEEVAVNKSFLAASSVMYDAVFVPGGSKNIDALLYNADALKFINEAYRHCKPIAAIGDGVKLLQKINIGKIEKIGEIGEIGEIKVAETDSNAIESILGVVTCGNKANLNAYFNYFKEAITAHRFWEREEL